MASGAFPRATSTRDNAGLSDNLSPTAQDLVSRTDHWQELEDKCARIEMANMRISNIDLTFAGADGGINYNFVVDDSEAGSAAATPARYQSTSGKFPRSVRSAEIEIQGEEEDVLGPMVMKANSISSSSDIHPEMTKLAELPAADPAILSYFDFVEDVLTEGDGEGHDDGAGPESGFQDASLYARMEGSQHYGVNQEIAELIRSRTAGKLTSHGGMALPSPGGLLHSSSYQQVGDAASQGPLSRMMSGNDFLCMDGDTESQCSEYPSEMILRSDTSNSSHHQSGAESPPWRKPQTKKLGGSCDELLPSNSLSSALGASKRHGRKILSGLFKTKGAQPQ